MVTEKRKHASIELSCLKKSDEKCTKVQKANVEVGCSIGGELRRQLPQQMSDASSSPQGICHFITAQVVAREKAGTTVVPY